MISILILCYGLRPVESRTLATLVQNVQLLSGCSLVVWNNGPNSWNESDKDAVMCPSVEFVWKETLDNLPLSTIYNRFLADFPAETYVIFDQDTDVSSDYLRHLVSTRLDGIGLPSISCLGTLYYPAVKYIYHPGPYKISDFVCSIGSGLVIGVNTVDKIKEKYGLVFDERFALYGVDTSFFYRFHSVLSNEDIVIFPTLEHSLSQFECENDEKLKFRRRERSYDAGLLLRHYCNRLPSLHLLSCVLKSLIGRLDYEPYSLIYAYIVGRHPKTVRLRGSERKGI